VSARGHGCGVGGMACGVVCMCGALGPLCTAKGLLRWPFWTSLMVCYGLRPV
jgi:hypothetical protein